MKLSSIIIAKDEEKNIARCIQSQINCIDEIVVVIDDSTKDNTLEIVKSFPSVKYEVVRWKGFAETKKYAVSLTSNDWVLWIDADEALNEELSEELKSFKAKEPAFDTYSFPRKANFLGRWIMHSGWYPARVIRLFNKHKVTFSDSNVHEHLIFSGETGKFKNDIEHYTDPNITHYFEKFNNYTTLAAEELFLNKSLLVTADLVLRPAAIFIKMFLLKRGFLDGIQGFILAIFSSAYVFTKYCKLWEKKVKV